MRHTARYPTKGAHRKIVAALKKLKQLPFESDVPVNDYIQKIEAWGDGDGVTDTLTDEGRRV